MPYRIRPEKPFTDEVRTVAGGQLAIAIDALEHTPNGLHEAIHEARKKFKRVRALYRLVARDDKDFRDSENVRLRDTARTLSRVRDAAALIETLGFLKDRCATDEERGAVDHALAILGERRDAIAKAETDLSDKVAAAADQCRKATEALDQLTFDDRPRKTARRLAKSWRKSLTKAQDALKSCHAGADGEVFHELRKAGQTYWMNLSLLREIWPSAMQAKRATAKTLVDLLGHEHDISVLVALIDGEAGLLGDGDQMAHLLGLIIREQQRIRLEALRLADGVFAEKPADEARIIELLWFAAATR